MGRFLWKLPCQEHYLGNTDFRLRPIWAWPSAVPSRILSLWTSDFTRQCLRAYQ